MFASAKENDDVRKLLTFQLRNHPFFWFSTTAKSFVQTYLLHKAFGPALIDHSLSLANFPDKLILGKTFNVQTDMDKLFGALLQAEKIMNDVTTQSSKVN